MTATDDRTPTAPGARRSRCRHVRSSARAAATGDARERSGPARAQLANAAHLLDEAAAARAEASELERRLGFVRAALRTLRTKSR